MCGSASTSDLPSSMKTSATCSQTLLEEPFNALSIKTAEEGQVHFIDFDSKIGLV
ncbi:hypothetical protein DPMN_119968 [Dreissena polymorpha]|uniref:Uncharacterized protein n=1 Tax=Dreissena polymorpha TaxID=45954 RepID=A0A9D4JN81_DREPO|nr:hypothetical protein DPMN_119968 [Dreissena polymorpha]